MNNMIQCPHCGMEFEISNESYAQILEHVRTEEFERILDQYKEQIRNQISGEYRQLLYEKEKEVQYYRDMKTNLSTKMVGETLEQHCQIEFDKLRMTAFPNAYFEKDNKAADHTKGDFIYREEADGVELLSIMFEMKNEMDTTAKKKTNESFLKKLDEDRTKKKCEYAVLVSLLERDNEYYNQGIVDVSYKYPKMYVVRPQFFIPIITLLRNAAMRSLEIRKQLDEARRQNFDAAQFEYEFNAFREKFDKNYKSANENFDKAIRELDSSIAHLKNLRDQLETTMNQLRLANDKAQKMTALTLAKNSPSIKEQLIKKP